MVLNRERNLSGDDFTDILELDRISCGSRSSWQWSNRSLQLRVSAGWLAGAVTLHIANIQTKGTEKVCQSALATYIVKSGS